MTERIRVLVADDNLLVRCGLVSVLTASADLEVVGEAGTAASALALCAATRPDVILLGLVMPDLDGAAATRAIRDRYPGTQVIVLTNWTEHDLVQHALAAGARGYLSKDSSADAWAAAIRAAHGGPAEAPAPPQAGLYLTARERAVLVGLLQGFSCTQLAEQLGVGIPMVQVHMHSLLNKLEARTDPAPLARPPQAARRRELTARELEVLDLMVQGLTNILIARQLYISRATVKFHVSGILHKLGATSRTEAVALAIQAQLLNRFEWSPLAEPEVLQAEFA